jgi:hypothetical protein
MKILVLWALFFVLYAASKIDFFTRYNPGGIAQYLRDHSIYWVAMAAAAFFIWLIEMFRSKSDKVTVKRIISLIVGILAGVAGIYLVFLSVVVLYGYGVPEAPNIATTTLAVIVLGLASAVLFESYRLLRFFSKKSN